MSNVKVTISDRDRYVGAMVRGLAYAVAGQKVVRGATADLLARDGFYVFAFTQPAKAAEFSAVVRKYLPLFADIAE